MSKLKELMEKNKKLQRKDNEIMSGDELPDTQELEYIEMPDWWQKGTNTRGLPFRKIVMIAGDSDSGKTSASIEAIKAAVNQGIDVLYCETEGKTTKKDFVDWGVDPKKIKILQESMAEKLYDKVMNYINDQVSKNPDFKLLLVIDSLGNVLSQRDMNRSLEDSSSQPGGKGKTNREGLNKIIAKRTECDIALLIINYTYDNLGSPGKTNAGGKALNFFSSLTYQTSRKGWIEAQAKGEKVRKGACVTWKLFKNHIDRTNPGPKSFELNITAEGIKLNE